MEDTFGRYFRNQVHQWLRKPNGSREGALLRTMVAGEDRVVVMESAHCPDGLNSQEVLVVEGDFSCGEGCVFTRPVYVGGNCQVGTDSKLEAIVVDGDLLLGPRVEVWGCADSNGPMELRPGSVVHGKAVSRSRIRIGMTSEAGSLFAPEVVTCEREDTNTTNGHDASGFLEIPPPAVAGSLGMLRLPGLSSRRLQPLSLDTWIYDGDFILQVPLVLRSKLVTQGSFRCPPESLLEEDVQVFGSLTVGANSVCQGSLLAGGDLELGPGCIFQGLLEARQLMRLCQGVRGFHESGPVEAIAAGSLLIERNVVVRGKLSSGHRVVTLPDEPKTALERYVAELHA